MRFYSEHILRDLFAVACSSLCILHCAFTPLLLAFGLIQFQQEWVHKVLLVPIILLAAWSFPTGFKVHQNLVPGYLGLFGVLCLIAALFFEGPIEPLITVFGAVICSIAHLLNRRALQRLCQTKMKHDMAYCK